MRSVRSTRIVAEALRVTPVPMAPPAEWAGTARLRALWDEAWNPLRHEGTPPAFLRAGQVDAWRRVQAALRGWHLALLAEPPGAGKTWVALATAAFQRTEPVVVGPSVLHAQWEGTAERAGVPIRFHSMERLSRGSVPGGDPRLVIIDEAHRLRHLDTRRTRAAAPWLAGRRVLMLTATPLVNRRGDLVALLRLMLPDDALALDGIPSLERLADGDRPPPALRRLVIRTVSVREEITVTRQTLPVSREERRRAADCVHTLATLTLGAEAAVQRLVRSVLLDAAASSDAAWRAALRRYRALLLQSRDAGGLSRAALRHFAGASLEQTVLWPLRAGVKPEAHGSPPPLADLPLVEAALAREEPGEPAFRALRALFRDGRPSVCFCRHLATAVALARALGDGTAWITGSAAGIGPHRLSRGDVLGAFGPRRAAWRLFRVTPRVLVTTEVLSEGLDLQGASRVVHVDLPWHPARHAQRTGRLARPGQLSPSVVEWIRPVAPVIERELGIVRGLRRKRRWVETWLAALEHGDPPPMQPPVATWCGTASLERVEAIALVHLHAGERAGTIALEMRAGRWEPATSTTLPARIAAGTPDQLRRLARIARRAAWRALAATRVPHAPNARIVARLLDDARRLRGARSPHGLPEIDRLLALVAAPAPLGVAWRLEELAAPDRPLPTASIPSPDTDSEPARVAWIAIVHSPPCRRGLR